ncbi:hypothetical protein [Halorubellus salinus]|uniref:hypothetical protein n=1 Tax=Halorubellus salinus TaxID=755309 RepID=UPI001D07E70E|nr:hypothetical protein [Halorubellus salinus]
MRTRRRRGSVGTRGYEPYVRLVGLLLVLLAFVLVFGLVVADLLFVVSGTLGVLGAVLAAFPGIVLSTLAAL